MSDWPPLSLEFDDTGPLPASGTTDASNFSADHAETRALARAESPLDGTPSAASPEEASLRGWIGRIVDHDEEAFALLYKAMIGRVYGLVLRIIRNAQTAEEVAEDTFWQAWRQAPRFDPARGNAAAWLLTIARSRALDALRRADRAENHAEPELMIDALQLNDADPQDLLAASQAGRRLHVALSGLEPLPRQLVALAFFQGLTHEEIARHTGLPLGTVKSHLRRTLAALRGLLASDNDSAIPAS